MNSLIKAVIVAVAVAAPVASFAQDAQPVTRAQVKAELQQLEAAGYRPSAGTDPYYPADLQAAQARIAAANGNVQTPAQDVGGVTGGAAHSSVSANNAGTKSIYFGM
ncbi:hypothetical protein C9I57_21915 [Trinickia symbiotica]|uniref:DUF4148 domain-containing protein n=1 Tax=Trinickia symbiotica TaxID=863227 RepID=A0A2T3XQ67_9BURK|nr:DUF4148 domain-containing protein [Trinickia symbiotica]PTB18666.1 hypothetical protein C9I57_21915 [Trinickia symbiotica]